MTQAPDIAFNYRSSRLLLLALCGVAVLAIVAVWISGVPVWMRAGLTVATAVLVGVAAGRLLRPRVGAVAWRGTGEVDLVLNDTPLDKRREARGEIRASRVMGSLIVLSLRWPPRERASLWLLPDNLGADTRRRLRVRLGVHVPGAASGNADSG